MHRCMIIRSNWLKFVHFLRNSGCSYRHKFWLPVVPCAWCSTGLFRAGQERCPHCFGRWARGSQTLVRDFLGWVEWHEISHTLQPRKTWCRWSSWRCQSRWVPEVLGAIKPRSHSGTYNVHLYLVMNSTKSLPPSHIRQSNSWNWTPYLLAIHALY